MLLLESFQDINYIETLVNYLDEINPELASLYFNEIFYQHFNKKFNQVKSALMSKIRDHNFFTLENFPFLHHFNSSNILTIEKDFSFHFYQRLRYEILRDPSKSKIFSRYIPVP